MGISSGSTFPEERRCWFYQGSVSHPFEPKHLRITKKPRRPPAAVSSGGDRQFQGGVPKIRQESAKSSSVFECFSDGASVFPCDLVSKFSFILRACPPKFSFIFLLDACFGGGITVRINLNRT